ncbi:hypothetical protein KDL01_16530 [Actinospica durhamensis]|uniref:Uncharacterized protein n=1 Tax=Actinospica durhamensis TaxID=1508375 RepID=A0A941ITZ0_9ACTN|nr:hypothetical protein [Actinospica durhamensis]MBR7834881.1 hypothetical protein [Actinospica durhamensis]
MADSWVFDDGTPATGPARWAFQGSLAAQLTGYASFDAIVERLRLECDRIVEQNLPEFPPPPTRRRLQFPDWWVPLTTAATTEALIWIAHGLAR